jgi:hypothetical protein
MSGKKIGSLGCGIKIGIFLGLIIFNLGNAKLD